MANGESHVKIAKDYFKRQFMNDGASERDAEAWAAGIVGNLMVESTENINPRAHNTKGGGQGAYGIAQWRGVRQAGLRQFAERRRANVDDFKYNLNI